LYVTGEHGDHNAMSRVGNELVQCRTDLLLGPRAFGYVYIGAVAQ
jgi:hypothetical protein